MSDDDADTTDDMTNHTNTFSPRFQIKKIEMETSEESNFQQTVARKRLDYSVLKSKIEHTDLIESLASTETGLNFSL